MEYDEAVLRAAVARSVDPKTRVGCVVVDGAGVVIASACNGFPTGVEVTAERIATRRMAFTEHAERNAMYDLARRGVSPAGAACHCSLFPCAECARAMAQCGVARVVAPEPDLDHERWGASWRAATEILREAGVEVEFSAAPE